MHAVGDYDLRPSCDRARGHVLNTTAHGGPAQIGAVALVVALDQDARHDRADRNGGVELGRVGHGLAVRHHPPARAFLVTALWVEVELAERGLPRLPVLGEAPGR